MDYNLIHYINILYYYYYNNHNSYLFFIFYYCVVVCACMRVCVCCAVLSLLCMCVCSLVCVSSHILIHVYLCVFTPAHPPRPCCGEEANVLIWGGGIFREKIFTKFGKWVYHVKTDRKSIFDLRKR